MGVNLWGESPLYMNPILSSDEGNESYIRRQGHHREVVSLPVDRQVKEAEVQSCDPTCLCRHADKRTETAHKAAFKEDGVGTEGEKSQATRLDGF